MVLKSNPLTERILTQKQCVAFSLSLNVCECVIHEYLHTIIILYNVVIFIISSIYNTNNIIDILWYSLV